MIINIAGTSGSGKTHLIRGFLAWAKSRGVVKSCYIDGRKEPIGYDIILPRSKTIHLVGAYENADTAGCDTIRDVVWAFDYIKEQSELNKHVVYEGLFMMNMTRGPQMAEELGNVTVLQLTDPLAVCIASINDRREARGEGPLRKKENTIGNFKRADNYAGKMRMAGAAIIRTNRDKALGLLVGLLGV